MQSAQNHYLRETTRQEVIKEFRALEISYPVSSACSLHHHIQNKRREAVSHLPSAVHVSFVLATSYVHVSMSSSRVHRLKLTMLCPLTSEQFSCRQSTGQCKRSCYCKHITLQYSLQGIKLTPWGVYFAS